MSCAMSDAPRTVVAVDIGGTKVACALVTLTPGEAPRIEDVEKVPTDAKLGGEHVLATVLATIQTVIGRATTPLVGVGISSAGVINPRTGDVTYANEVMPGWGGTHLATEVTRATGLPCRVLNDVHAHALGEARWGGGRGVTSCLVVAVGTGISGAYVERGHIMLGAHDVAGHVGHIACIEAAGVPCTCGRSGHLEPIAAGPGIIKSYVDRSGKDAMPDGTPVGGAEVSQLADAGDPDAIFAEHLAGHALGSTLGSVANILDPAAIILSGSVANSGRVWHEALAEGFASQGMDPVLATPILSGALGGDAPLIGAAENLVESGYASFDE